MANYILVINPGSTSTKVAVYKDTEPVFTENISHTREELAPFARITDQYEFRKNIILKLLEEKHIDPKSLTAVVGRGGLIRPIPSGTYIINEQMKEDLRKGLQGEHASNLGGLIADAIASPLNIPAFIVDPVVVDEMEPVAKVTGMPEITRKSIFHALNHKAVARRAAADLGRPYEELNLILAHLGGGISIGAHVKGKVVDVNNALNGDGPFAPERAGTLPAYQLAELIYDGKFDKEKLKKRLAGQGGVVAHLGVNDMREVVRMIEAGNDKARLVYEALIYNVAKEIGKLAPVMYGKVDAVVLTGGLAKDKVFIEKLKERISYLGKILVYPGEDEMIALALGALRVLEKKEEARTY
ncbi:MAG: butyrate kinase [Thermoplasmata archaeon]